MNNGLEEAFARQGDCSQKEPKDIKIIAKYFNPTGAASWYCYEYDPKTRIFWGYANLGDKEMAECGAISLDELESVKGLFGLGIERDLHFGKEHTLAEVIEKY
jgi:hypothetical protein